MTTQTPTKRTTKRTTTRRTTKKAATKKAAAPSPAAKPGAPTKVEPSEKPVPRLGAEKRKALSGRWNMKFVKKHGRKASGLVVRVGPESSTKVRELTDSEVKALEAGVPDDITQAAGDRLAFLLRQTVKRPVTHEGSGRPKTGRGAWDPQEGRCIGFRPGQRDDSTPPRASELHSGNAQPYGPTAKGAAVGGTSGRALARKKANKK